LGYQQVDNLINLSRFTTCRDRCIRLTTSSTELAAQVECRKRPGLQQIAN